MGVGLPKVLYPAELLAGSGLCGMEKSSPTAVTTTYQTTISGHATQVATTLTGTTTTTSTPSETESSLAPASVCREDLAISLTATLLTMALSSLGGVYTWLW